MESESDRIDCAGATSRCSCKLVYKVISDFSEQKKELVREMRFGGILDFPSLSNLNLKFSAWLLTRLDHERGAILCDHGKELIFRDIDVQGVMGVPCGGKPIVQSSAEKSVEALTVVRKRLGANTRKDCRSLKAAQTILAQTNNFYFGTVYSHKLCPISSLYTWKSYTRTACLDRRQGLLVQQVQGHLMAGAAATTTRIRSHQMTVSTLRPS